MGQVCARHDEYFETECRWCEPADVVRLYNMVPDKGLRAALGYKEWCVPPAPGDTRTAIRVVMEAIARGERVEFADNDNAAEAFAGYVSGDGS